MTQSPPQGAQSADPVREALHRITIVATRPTETGVSTLNGCIAKLREIQAIARTALAAPEGPRFIRAQTRAGYWENLPVGDEGPEAPPPVEASQPLTDALDRPQHCPDCLTACHDCPAGFVPLDRAALAAPAGAIQPHLDHQVGPK